MIKSNTIILINLPLILQILTILIIIIPSKRINFHPINFIAILIILTILLCLKINFIKKSLIPFIIFLTQIGGLFIILIYIIRLTNNNFTKLNLNNILLIIIKFRLIYLYIYIINLIYNNPHLPKNLIFNYYNININTLFNYNFMLTLFLIIYLLYSIICIINICNKYKYPLRQLYLYE